MGLFSSIFGGSTKRVEPYDLLAPDAEQLASFAARGADIEAPRESEFFLSFTSEPRVRAAVDELRTMGVVHELVEPSHDIPEWMIFVRGYRKVLVPDFLRETVDLCRGIAAKHGGDFEGWAGLLTDAEKDAD